MNVGNLSAYFNKEIYGYKNDINFFNEILIRIGSFPPTYRFRSIKVQWACRAGYEKKGE